MATATQIEIRFSEAEAYDRTLALIDDKLANVTIGGPEYDLLAQLVEVMDANSFESMEADDKVEAYGRTVALINKLMSESRYGSPRFNTLQLLLDWLEANEL